MMRKIAVLTSGGDAPGMNAAIRATVRTGLSLGWEILGVSNGYSGLISGTITPLGAREVGGIIQRGGTMLGSARCKEFETEAGQLKALDQLQRHEIDGLVVVGGNGSQTGAHALSKLGFPVIGVASTIDNDLSGTDVTIGVTSAIDVALEAIDRLKVTGASHQRAFLVEVMGRKCGYLALMAGLTGGADAIVIPEQEVDVESVAENLRAAYANGKAHAIVVVAEGARNNAERMADFFQKHHERLGFDLRVTKLGHVQRGVAPGAYDRLLGTLFGAAATDQLAKGSHGVLVGMINGKVSTTPLAEVVSQKKALDLRLLDLAHILAK
jgi:6-phosphofructokinase 1